MRYKHLIVSVLSVLIFGLSCPGLSFAQDKGTLAPDFSLSTPQGTAFKLSDYKETKNVVLIFWKINGPYCAFELEKMRDRYPDLQKNDFEVLAVNVKEESTKVQDFVTNEKISFPILLDTNREVSKMYEAKGVPIILIIDKQGVIKWRGYEFPQQYLEYVK